MAVGLQLSAVLKANTKQMGKYSYSYESRIMQTTETIEDLILPRMMNCLNELKHWDESQLDIMLFSIFLLVTWQIVFQKHPSSAVLL